MYADLDAECRKPLDSVIAANDTLARAFPPSVPEPSRQPLLPARAKSSGRVSGGQRMERMRAADVHRRWWDGRTSSAPQGRRFRATTPGSARRAPRRPSSDARSASRPVGGRSLVRKSSATRQAHRSSAHPPTPGSQLGDRRGTRAPGPRERVRPRRAQLRVRSPGEMIIRHSFSFHPCASFALCISAVRSSDPVRALTRPLAPSRPGNPTDTDGQPPPLQPLPPRHPGADGSGPLDGRGARDLLGDVPR